MKPRIIIRPAAQADLDDHAEYIGQDSPSTALRFLVAAEDDFGKLSRMPGIGHIWPTDNPRLQGIRVWPIHKFPKHLVFYRETNDGVEILHIFHGARNINAILDSENA